jgi:hypothetical protein
MTTLQHQPLGPALVGATPRPLGRTGTGLADADDLTGRLAQHLVATALVRKSPIDPVPFPVWWRVVDALRASLLAAPGDAVCEVDEAVLSLVAHAAGLAVGPPVALPPGEDVDRALRHAQLLVARLVFTPGPTSPTLLHVRLARLRRALVAAG